MFVFVFVFVSVFVFVFVFVFFFVSVSLFFIHVCLWVLVCGQEGAGTNAALLGMVYGAKGS